MMPAADWLNPNIDIEKHRLELKRQGRTQIRDFFHPEIARRLFHCLREEVQWDIAYRQGKNGVRVPTTQWRELSENERQYRYQVVCSEARTQFQFWYQTYMMVSAFLAGRDPNLFLHQLLQWMNSPVFLELGRELSGAADIRKVDAQATSYTPGCFLTAHDDSGEPTGQIRRLAYVMSFSEKWLAEWGGLLHFLNQEGDVIDTFLPRFNTLNLFLTPQMHAVSCVAPFAPVPRLSITGWYRAD